MEEVEIEEEEEEQEEEKQEEEEEKDLGRCFAFFFPPHRSSCQLRISIVISALPLIRAPCFGIGRLGLKRLDSLGLILSMSPPRSAKYST